MKPTKCDHHIPETLKQTGPCKIAWEVKKRNGKPNWWCTTHAQEASGPDGAALSACPGAWFDSQPAPRELDIDATSGVFSGWGALAPAIQIGNCPIEPGGVHIHRRKTAGAKKDLDDSFDIVRIHGRNGMVVTVETMAAQAYSISELSGQQVEVLQCPKGACGFKHIDELKFATNGHVKHLCNKCGRNFRRKALSIGNPLADAFEILGIPRPPEPVAVDRPLSLNREDYSGIGMWASNKAIITNCTKAEDRGIHVHAWDHSGRQVLDETYSPVYLDGELIDEAALRALNVQRELAHGTTPILALACNSCGSSVISPASGWIEADTTHTCQVCSHTNMTRRRVFLNPLADKSGGTTGGISHVRA
jgi:hypothetical protein